MSAATPEAAEATEAVDVILDTNVVLDWLVFQHASGLAIGEAIVPTGTLPGPVELVRSTPQRWRRSRRYLTILRILARRGLGRYLRPGVRAGEADARTARALRDAMADGGVTFVKLGQMLATRPDLLRAAAAHVPAAEARLLAERDGILERLAAEKKRGKPQVTRFKGLGEMNPPQLRETTMDPNTRRLVQLSLDDFQATHEVMDMLLAKKRAGDRKSWLESKGNLAEVLA